MYLSEIKLNHARRDTARLLASPQRIHAAVLDGFPSLDSERILWRLDQGLRHESKLYVVSPDRPDFTSIHELYSWSRLPYEESIRTADYSRLITRLEGGEQWGFRLRANTVKKKSVPREGKNDRITRVPVPENEVSHWLTSREEAIGVSFTDFSSDTSIDTFNRKGNKMTLQSTEFEGVLTVVDPDRFRNALINGIGPAKAHGCGLITISRTI